MRISCTLAWPVTGDFYFVLYIYLSISVVDPNILLFGLVHVTEWLHEDAMYVRDNRLWFPVPAGHHLLLDPDGPDLHDRIEHG